MNVHKRGEGARKFLKGGPEQNSNRVDKTEVERGVSQHPLYNPTGEDCRHPGDKK